MKGVSPLIGAGLAALPAVATLGGAGLGAGLAGGGAFAAGGAAIGAFASIAKPVLSQALAAEQAVSKAQQAYNAAIAGGTKQATAYAAEQKAISAAYDHMSPQQVVLSKQLAAMSDSWKKIKAAETPVVAGALQPWLKSVSDLMKLLDPIVDRVSTWSARWAPSSRRWSAARHSRRSLASWPAPAPRCSGGRQPLIDFIQALVILLPKFNPLIQAAAGWLGNLGPNLLTRGPPARTPLMTSRNSCSGSTTTDPRSAGSSSP